MTHHFTPCPEPGVYRLNELITWARPAFRLAVTSPIKNMSREKRMSMAGRTLKATDPKVAAPSKPKMLIFGKPGVGKTWASLDFPAVYYMDTEGGANLSHYTDKLKASGGVYFGPAQGSHDYDSVLDEIVTLATTSHPYKTLVIDSFSKLYNTQIDATHQRMQEEKKKIEFSIEKKEAIAKTRRLVRWLDRLDMNVILICHEKDRWEKGEVIGQTFDGWDKLEYELHLALQIVKQGKTRKAKVVKSRLEQFPDADIFDWSFAEFASRYGEDVIVGESVPVIIATPEQIRRLQTLVEALHVPGEVTGKWLEKAGVEAFEEMDTQTIQKCIMHLEQRLPKPAA